LFIFLSFCANRHSRIPLQAFIFDFKWPHGRNTDMVLDSKWQVYEHVRKPFALNRIPAQTFNTDIVASLSELLALKADLMSLKFDCCRILIIGGPQKGASSVQIHLLCSLKRRPVNSDVLGQVKIEVLVRARKQIDSTQSS